MAKKCFGNLTLLLSKTWATFCSCFDHQHGRLITWLQPGNRNARAFSKTQDIFLLSFINISREIELKVCDVMIRLRKFSHWFFFLFFHLLDRNHLKSNQFRRLLADLSKILAWRLHLPKTRVLNLSRDVSASRTGVNGWRVRWPRMRGEAKKIEHESKAPRPLDPSNLELNRLTHGACCIPSLFPVLRCLWAPQKATLQSLPSLILT